jgi:hypothetical protein
MPRTHNTQQSTAWMHLTTVHPISQVFCLQPAATADRHAAGSGAAAALLPSIPPRSSAAQCLCAAGSAARCIQLQPARDAAGGGPGARAAAALDA